MTKITGTNVSTKELTQLWRELGIATERLEARNLIIFEQADELVRVDGRDGVYQMHPEAASKWKVMHKHAMDDGIEFFLVSAFRSYNYQARLIQEKMDNGDKLECVTRSIAPPGCSQHHTGRAIDLGTPESDLLEEDFETTEAFDWLRQNAKRYGFVMPFDKRNVYGFVYEPWHWYLPEKQ